ncbi:Uncharacterised protein [Burkholderia pseudomallei]|nr:Uncharacterised protein [Burkholderia pseudomallei]
MHARERRDDRQQRSRAGPAVERDERRIDREHQRDARPPDDPVAPVAVRQMAADRRDHREDRAGDAARRHRQPARQMQHLHAVDRHVEHDDVVDRRAADRDAEAGEHGLAVMAQHVGERQRRGVAARRGSRRRRLVDRAPQPVAERREQRADDERHAPPPVLELRGAERRREQHAGERAGERGEPLARELERRIEAAPRLRRLLDQQRGGRADLAAGREPLQQARGHEQQRRRDADLRVSRRDGDRRGAERHDE